MDLIYGLWGEGILRDSMGSSRPGGIDLPNFIKYQPPSLDDSSSEKRDSTAKLNDIQGLQLDEFEGRQFNATAYSLIFSPTAGSLLIVASVALTALGLGILATGLAAGKRSLNDGDSILEMSIAWIKNSIELYQNEDISELDCYRFLLDLSNYTDLPENLHELLEELSNALLPDDNPRNCATRYPACSKSNYYEQKSSPVPQKQHYSAVYQPHVAPTPGNKYYKSTAQIAPPDYTPHARSSAPDNADVGSPVPYNAYFGSPSPHYNPYVRSPPYYNPYVQRSENRIPAVPYKSPSYLRQQLSFPIPYPHQRTNQRTDLLNRVAQFIANMFEMISNPNAQAASSASRSGVGQSFDASSIAYLIRNYISKNRMTGKELYTAAAVLKKNLDDSQQQQEIKDFFRLLQLNNLAQDVNEAYARYYNNYELMKYDAFAENYKAIKISKLIREALRAARNANKLPEANHHVDPDENSALIIEQADKRFDLPYSKRV
ncbi:unnamed protein product [Cyprideis torosa]|uniref:Uncharacterized protein n=1 Tax=Cyprideis torosa TaxID=163714 RepID=A0A7R8WBD0_9CRUS|nr:unnamed protein product [Cyprideis torosa]CAG0892134.1 unnamed protein product [Cyprideis torosa]